MNPNLINHLEKEIFNTKITQCQSVGGGSINNTYKITTNQDCFFIKTNTNNVFKNGFKEEVLGLNFLENNSALAPKIISEGSFQNQIFLILEWIETGFESKQFWLNFAQQLVNLHINKYEMFGLYHNNFMGQLPQNNSFSNNFSEFFIENRLQPQIELAFNNNKLQKKHLLQFEKLYKQLSSIFPKEKPCAVHGDLWSGNFMCSSNEKVVLIDPAVYYGHREIDLAMSTLFGGFSSEFYNNYQEIYPLEKGFNHRKDIYNLYPLLIHLNLFGSSYLRSIENIINN